MCVCVCVCVCLSVCLRVCMYVCMYALYFFSLLSSVTSHNVCLEIRVPLGEKKKGSNHTWVDLSFQILSSSPK